MVEAAVHAFTPSTWRDRQIFEFEASQVYSKSSRTARATQKLWALVAVQEVEAGRSPVQDQPSQYKLYPKINILKTANGVTQLFLLSVPLCVREALSLYFPL